MTAVAQVEIRHLGVACVVTLAGEIDVATAPDIVQSVAAATRERPDQSVTIIMDLSRVTFIDASGMSALVAVQREAARRRRQVTVLRRVPSHIARVFRMAGLDDMFTFV
jgi:anti-sigma B factor antagonist